MECNTYLGTYLYRTYQQRLKTREEWAASSSCTGSTVEPHWAADTGGEELREEATYDRAATRPSQLPTGTPSKRPQ